MIVCSWPHLGHWKVRHLTQYPLRCVEVFGHIVLRQYVTSSGVFTMSVDFKAIACTSLGSTLKPLLER